ncbi:hypothetical protein XELAEV_18004341mg [Xenopus laevis]|uniref:Uncharacterized protein n=1 Tax=Xenopus laevis TaxID=8355 RepID=A0A974BRH8_XENLA|nr:hypothetical protein XELAEV_18003288mg [Xenopus laevis]OCT56813.1 hypothetical protein XELAEV_18004341mg [Xenopus laevis]
MKPQAPAHVICGYSAAVCTCRMLETQMPLCVCYTISCSTLCLSHCSHPYMSFMGKCLMIKRSGGKRSGRCLMKRQRADGITPKHIQQGGHWDL